MTTQPDKPKIITATGQSFKRVAKFVATRRFGRQLMKNDQHSSKGIIEPVMKPGLIETLRGRRKVRV